MTLPADAIVLRERLVSWFRVNARVLPWRTDPQPYHVLLSELMLQQTRVETVLPYYARFLARWPTIEALAAAEHEEVLHAWAGLGYYRRARALHAAAQAAVAAGGLTGDVDALLRLPGIGPYTSGAIAAIAYGVPAAAVDGNVERVLTRVDGNAVDPASTAGKAWLRGRALALSAPGMASEVVQGLMELGATVCTPRAPACGRCPWGGLCAAQASGQPEALPNKQKKAPPKEVRGAAGLLWREGAVLMGRRPPGLLGGLWEPISVEGDDLPEALLVRAFRERAGLEVRVVKRLGPVVHVFTHRRLALEVMEVEVVAQQPLGGDGSYTGLAWITPGADTHALSRLAEKVVEAGLGVLLAAEPRP